MTMDELSAALTLAEFERRYELAVKRYTHAGPREEQIAAWEHVTDLAHTIRGHCIAYNLIPSVDVGALHG